MDNAQNGYSSVDNTGKIKKRSYFLRSVDFFFRMPKGNLSFMLIIGRKFKNMGI